MVVTVRTNTTRRNARERVEEATEVLWPLCYPTQGAPITERVEERIRRLVGHCGWYLLGKMFELHRETRELEAQLEVAEKTNRDYYAEEQERLAAVEK